MAFKPNRVTIRKKWRTLEEIVSELRSVDVLVAQGDLQHAAGVADPRGNLEAVLQRFMGVSRGKWDGGVVDGGCHNLFGMLIKRSRPWP